MLKFIVNGKEMTEEEIRNKSIKDIENTDKQCGETYSNDVSIIIED